MKKLIALCMAFILSATVLSACSNGEENDTENKENTTSTESSTEEKTTSTEAQNSINIEDVDLFDFSFELDGVVYTLPCDFSEFEKNGWKIVRSGTTNWTEEFEIRNDNYSDDSYNNVKVSFLDATSSDKELEERQVSGFSVFMDISTDGLNNSPVVKFPRGLSIDRDVTSEDIIAKYGEPDKYYRRDVEQIEYYKQEGDYKKGFVAGFYSDMSTASHKINNIFRLSCEYSPETALENSTEAEEGTENTTQTATEGLTATEPTTNENAT